LTEGISTRQPLFSAIIFRHLVATKETWRQPTPAITTTIEVSTELNQPKQQGINAETYSAVSSIYDSLTAV